MSRALPSPLTREAAPDALGTAPLPDLLLVGAGGAHPRWQPGERLDRVFEERCDRLRAEGRADTLAVDAGDIALTYDDLDARANRLARHLVGRRVGGGHRVALVFDDPVPAYVAMLAVLKAGAAYVPLDPAFPPDRLAYIVADAGVSVVLTLSHLRAGLRDVPALLVAVDDMAERIAAEDGSRLDDAERGEPAEDLAYLIYTSGTTGRPKGVAIDHAAICNFVRVAAEVYDVRPGDRMYQGLTIAFDFSVEEIWVTWMVGGTLVPKPPGGSLLGTDLHAFLTERRVTALCCVPTLLATIEDDLPQLRFLLVSGEACPQDLINRWHRPGRRFLNTYGPTEATVTATWTTLHPDRPVTIGRPLPTYTTVILDPEDPMHALPHGEVGEIGIAGVGLAAGYLNRTDLTEKAFVTDFLGIPANPSGRIYRTGDLGRVDASGEISYLGRIDLQVKVRGYRIELTEIESVLLQVPGVAAAVVDTVEPTPGTTELVGYYSVRTGTTEPALDAIVAHLRKQLPAYMVPAFLERLATIPMTAQGKVDRRALPPPTTRRTADVGEYVAPATDTEHVLADALAHTLGIGQVSVESDFFADLGASSLLMAQFSARARRESGPSGLSLSGLSMREIYQNPTVRALAAVVGDAVPAAEPAADAEPARVRRATKVGYVLTGLVQLLVFLAVAAGAEQLGVLGYQWVYAAVGWPAVVERAAVVGVGVYVGLCVLPIVAKWVLVGRWKPAEIRLWSPRYLRFWLVKTLIRLSPLARFSGSPLYPLYLRALGARIGRGVLILSRTVPVATDLITIGAGSVVRKNTSFSGYRVVGGVVQIGPVRLGDDVLVGEQSVLDIGTAMGDGAQLGHSSSLQEGQTVPAGERWHGSPAEPGAVDYRVVPPARVGVLRRIVYSTGQLVAALVPVVAVLALTVAVPKAFPVVADLVVPDQAYLLERNFYLVVLALSFVLFFGLVVLWLLVMVTVPRLPRLLVRPDRVYRVFGFRYVAMSLVRRLTNSRFFMLVLGDSSYIVHFVRGLGYDLSPVVQTGSNFGTEMQHDTPFLTTVGTGTMVSDGLSMMNADWSSTSFRVSRAAIGERNFIGNNVVFPVGARTGANTLLATKVMVPLDGPVREDVGLLGSPPFEIPRHTGADNPLRTMSERERHRRLIAKNWHNAGSILTVLVLQWIRFFVVLLIAAAGLDLYERFSGVAIMAAIVVVPVFSVLYSVLLERAVMGFRALRPRNCSIYDRYFWRHERMWKVYTRPIFVGTPFRGLLLRMAGVRVGRRVFDDGCVIPEKSLVTIGDDATLNATSVIQCHSLEDGLFASDRTVVGAGVTLGVSAFVHYGVTMGGGSALAADAYLMKGEEVPAGASWVGNPARSARTALPASGAPAVAA